jgi:hypothetical protein
MRRIIFITGETAQGKTTFAYRLAEFLNLPVISTDEMYLEGICTEKEYKKVFKGIKKGQNVIVEGAHTGDPEVRELILSILKPDWYYMLKIQSPNWESRVYEKWIIPELFTQEEIKDKNDYFNEYYKPCEYTYTITGDFQEPNNEVDFLGGYRYQRIEKTKRKLEAAGLDNTFWDGESILDIGCNEGQVYDILKPYISSYKGIDTQWMPLELGLAKNPKLNVMLEDLKTCEDKVGVVVALSIFHRFNDEEFDFLLKKYSKQCDFLIMEVPITKGPKSWWSSDRSEKDILEVSRKYFSNVIIGEQSNDGSLDYGTRKTYILEA